MSAEGSLSITVKSAVGVGGRLAVPGDKSISHRVAMLSGMSKGRSEIRGFLRGEDCEYTLDAMVAVGAKVTRGEDVIYVEGNGGRFVEPVEPIYLGNSGTGIRLLTGLFAGQGINVTLSGDAYLNVRPMRRVSDPLNAMGGEISVTGEKGTPPIEIKAGAIQSIDYSLPVASAQVKSCVLLAGLMAEGTTRVIEPAATRDHTEQLFVQAGIPVRVEGLTVELDGFGSEGPMLQARDWVIPGDPSSAAFWAGAAAMGDGAEVVIENVGINPRRTGLFSLLKRMGAELDVDVADDVGEPRGAVRITGRSLQGVEILKEEVPNLIDELPLVAVVATCAEGTTIIRHAEELRVKETDRIRAMVTNFRSVGIEVEELGDGMVIHGPQTPSGGVVDSFGDHRIAMAFAVLGFFSEQPIQINDVACIATSYPTFWKDYTALGGEIVS